MRTILAGIVLCTAFAVGDRPCPVKARADRRTDARGYRARQGADRGRRLRKLPHRRSRKTVRRGQADRHPVRRHLLAQPDAGPRDRASAPGAMTISTARCASAWRATVRAITRPSPIRISRKLTRQDILAIRAYLATLTPVSNAPRAPELRWPFNYRVVMRGWNWLFFKPGILMPDQQKSAEWNRGRYLVEGVAPLRRLPYAEEHLWRRQTRPDAYGGGRVAGMFAPRLDGAERSGLKSWSVEDITEYLQSGRNAKKPCRRVDVGGRGQFDLEDERCGCPRHRGLPEGPAGGRARSRRSPRPRRRKWRQAKSSTTAPASPATKTMDRAAPRIYPPLPGNANLQSADASSTLRIILDGAETVTTPRAPNKGSMPAYAAKMTDQQIADVTNYIRNAWGNAAPSGDARIRSPERGGRSSSLQPLARR